MIGTQVDESFGRSVATVDYNQDGFVDVAVGAPYADGGGTDSGMVYIYHGAPGSSFDATSDQTLTVLHNSAWFGFTLAQHGVGPSSSGPSMLVVGAPRWGAGNAGRAFLYYACDIFPSRFMAGVASNSSFGWSVSGY